MKKILFVCDANNFPSGAFRFLKDYFLQEPFLLTGAFFHSINYDTIVPLNLAFTKEPIVAYSDADVKAVSGSIEKFASGCQLNGIDYRVHEESEEFKIKDLVKESRFADLIVMSEELFCSQIEPAQPNKYMKQVMHDAECPLMIVPEHYKPFTRIAVAYDGRKASMHALKQFCALFPDFTRLQTDIFYWVDKTDDDIPDHSYIEEYASRHFNNVNFRELFFDTGKYLAEWAHDRPDTLFVTGSYNRSGWSTLFHKSFIDDMVKHATSLIFIAPEN